MSTTDVCRVRRFLVMISGYVEIAEDDQAKVKSELFETARELNLEDLSVSLRRDLPRGVLR